MKHVSKIVVCVCWSTLAAAPAHAALVIRTGPVPRPTTLPRMFAPRFAPAIGGRVGAARVGRRILPGGYGYGALGLAGFGLDTLGVGGPAPFGPDGEPGSLPPPVLLPPPPPPACPLIIEVGRGLMHKAKTRIVSGHPVCR